ncbi:integrin [Mactra antiquata]
MTMATVCLFLCVLYLTINLSICLPSSIPAVHKSECRSLMDLVLVVDGSDSILAEDYKKQRSALAALMKELGLGPKQARVGMVVYSTTIAQSIDLTYNREELVKWSLNMVHPRDGTMTSLGIAKARKIFEKSGRPQVPWVCIVITDGLSKYPDKTAKESDITKSLGVNMFAVGISNFIEKTELEAIATDPSQVLMLQSFDQLKIALSGLMKVVCPCPPPPPVQYGVNDDGPRAIGSVRSYKCESGYQPMGNDKIECLKDSTWSNLEFTCLACPPPPIEYGHGIISDGLNVIDSVREYVCENGYSSPEPLISKCIPGPEGPYWTLPEITCLNCPPIIDIINGYSEPLSAPPIISTVVSYQCNPGFIPTGPIESTCIEEKGVPGWTEIRHKCIACGEPPIAAHAEVDHSGNTLVNSVRVYQCLPGYHPTGPIEAICMGEKGATFWRTTKHICKACDKPPKLPNAVLVEPGDTLVGTIRVYQCLNGFQPTGPIETTCAAINDVTYWDEPQHKCVACIPPPILPNAILDPIGDTLIGSIRSYHCMEGFVPTGPIEVGCIKGTGGPLWTGSEFHCVACAPPPELPNAMLDASGSNLVGHKRMYYCLDGYVPTKPGPVTMECIGEYIDHRGKAYWSPPSHECIACSDPPPLSNAEVEPGSNLVGTERRYMCTGGFHATGPIVVKCKDDAHWSIPEFSCTACGETPDVPNAIIMPGPHTLGTIRKYDCINGLVPDLVPTIKCLDNAQWSPVKFQCVGCKPPPDMPFAVLEPGDTIVNAVRRYTCIPGFLETGPITSTCSIPPNEILPRWSSPVHFCKDCGDPPHVEFADIIDGPRTLGAVQKYVCHKGFVPSGPPHSHCMPNAEWSPPAFKCIVPKKPKEKIVYVKVHVPFPVPVYIHKEKEVPVPVPVKKSFPIPVPVPLPPKQTNIPLPSSFPMLKPKVKLSMPKPLSLKQTNPMFKRRKLPTKDLFLERYKYGPRRHQKYPKKYRQKYPKKSDFKPKPLHGRFNFIDRRDPAPFIKGPYINLALGDKNNVIIGQNHKFAIPAFKEVKKIEVKIKKLE